MRKVSVFCAVWSKDPHRHQLLRTHRENLRRQTQAVEPVYVFDGGDPPPAWLDAQTIAVGSDLTIYQAWNFALTAVTTPLVMNLNLDDRLAPDAVEKMAAHLEARGALLAGGDWRICHSQDETDAVGACVPVQDVPFSPDCPPAVETPRRLGSGTGERLTFGPGTLWRMEAHVRVPRYPWRLNDGTLIKSVADGAFWSVLGRLGAPLTRLPMVIGNYHFHPQDQAEYRHKENLLEMLPRLMKI
jgi:hypothetical protein